MTSHQIGTFLCWQNEQYMGLIQKLTAKTERRLWCWFRIFVFNCEKISFIVLVAAILTLSTYIFTC